MDFYYICMRLNSYEIFLKSILLQSSILVLMMLLALDCATSNSLAITPGISDALNQNCHFSVYFSTTKGHFEFLESQYAEFLMVICISLFS